MATGTKPAKPRGSPLTPHPNGSWAKRIRGKLHYFGPWDDHAGAVRRYQEMAGSLHSGRRAKAANPDDVTVAMVCNQFLSAKLAQMEAGELKPSTFNDYRCATDRVISAVGRGRLVSDLRPDDFGLLRQSLAKTLGAHSLATHVRMIRSVFTWAWENEVIREAVRYGASFNEPTKRSRRGNAKAAYSAADVRKIIKASSGQLKAMILLAINGGLGQTDCAELTHGELDLKRNLLIFPRPKTGIDRVVPLWDQTAKAIRESKESGEFVFLTKYGNQWVRQVVHEREGGGVARVTWIDSVSLEYGKVRRAVKVGGSFYLLRHTFRTVADETGDQHAIARIMGHALPGMASVYVRSISEERLRAVVNHVEKWLGQ